MPPDHVEHRETAGFPSQDWGARARGVFESTYDSPGWKRAQASAKAAAEKPVVEAYAQILAAADPNGYKRGDRVAHAKFGKGQITAVEGNKLTVAFDDSGEKRVIASFVKRA